MNSLIRFEDKYGMADIWHLINGIIPEYVKNIKEDNKEKNTEDNNIRNQFNKINDNTFTQLALTTGGVFLTSEDEIAFIKKNHIEQIILVYDLDTLDNKSKLDLDNSVFKGYLNRLKSRLEKNIDYNIEIKLAPTVWSAETFALYILACDRAFDENSPFAANMKQIDAAELIHDKNTPAFQGEIINGYIEYLLKDKNITYLRDMLKHIEKIKYKQVGIYIPNDPKTLKNSFQYILEIFPNTINKEILTYLITNNSEVLFNTKSIFQHYKDIETFRNKHKAKQGEFFTNIAGQQLSFNKINWKNKKAHQNKQV